MVLKIVAVLEARPEALTQAVGGPSEASENVRLPPQENVLERPSIFSPPG
jgi:hypothetical protein